jgi:hypothetical protein
MQNTTINNAPYLTSPKTVDLQTIYSFDVNKGEKPYSSNLVLPAGALFSLTDVVNYQGDRLREVCGFYYAPLRLSNIIYIALSPTNWNGYQSLSKSAASGMVEIQQGRNKVIEEYEKRGFIDHSRIRHLRGGYIDLITPDERPRKAILHVAIWD